MTISEREQTVRSWTDYPENTYDLIQEILDEADRILEATSNMQMLSDAMQAHRNGFVQHALPIKNISEALVNKPETAERLEGLGIDLDVLLKVNDMSTEPALECEEALDPC